MYFAVSSVYELQQCSFNKYCPIVIYTQMKHEHSLFSLNLHLLYILLHDNDMQEARFVELYSNLHLKDSGMSPCITCVFLFLLFWQPCVGLTATVCPLVNNKLREMLPVLISFNVISKLNWGPLVPSDYIIYGPHTTHKGWLWPANRWNLNAKKGKVISHCWKLKSGIEMTK